MGYQQIKRLAKRSGLNIPELLTLHRKNDPFFVGSPAQVAQAEWFAELWERFGYRTGVHLRRVHYRLASQESATKHDGEPYENTNPCWNYLCDAGKYARYLGLLDPEAFVDRRNPEPHVFLYPELSEPVGWEYEPPDWELPRIQPDLVSSLGELTPPLLFPTGYEYRDNLQPYHVEVWVEKTTMNDELLPLCQRHAVNLVTGVGFMSITSVINLLWRVRRLGKPSRVLYVSDFDPAGDSMPVSVARQIEFWLRFYELGANVKLEPVVLTATQVQEYALPRKPIKESDLRRGNFEATHGKGAVELDALEALHPGELARIVGDQIAQFRDDELAGKAEDAYEEAQECLEDELESRAGPHLEELDEIKEEAATVVERYQERLERLSVEMEAELTPYRERLEAVRLAVQNELEQMQPNLPALPEPETYPERNGWLFDSGRPYLEQLASYKAHQRGNEG
jgi:hypothetical protein